jgi:hypothetical protein
MKGINPSSVVQCPNHYRWCSTNTRKYDTDWEANGNGGPPNERRIVNEEKVDERRSRLDMIRPGAHGMVPNINIRDDIIISCKWIHKI